MESAVSRRHFLTRAYVSAIALYLAALLVSLGLYSLQISLGLTAGAGLAIAILASWHFVVTRLFVAPEPGAPAQSPSGGAPGPAKAGTGGAKPRPRRERAVLACVFFVKLVLVGAIVYVLLGRGLVNGPAFAIGFALPQVAVALLALGSKTARRDSAEEGRRVAARG